MDDTTEADARRDIAERWRQHQLKADEILKEIRDLEAELKIVRQGCDQLERKLRQCVNAETRHRLIRLKNGFLYIEKTADFSPTIKFLTGE